MALAICVETRQVVDYDNARVYILGGDGMTLEPVAFHADTEEYAGETADALRVSVGEGITGWVAQHGEPLIVTDASRDPRSLQIPGTPDVAEESMLLVPLRDDGAVTGVIVLSKLGIARFDQDDLRLLQILSDQAAIAIENARLLGARDRLVAELNCMLDISLTYAQADEELALAGLLSMKLARAGRADACIISRWEESAASLRTLGAHGVAVPDPTYDVLGSPVTRNVLRDARPEVLQAAGGHDPGEVRLMGTLDARTLLLLPLIAAGCTIGLVELLWVAAAKTFTPDELDVYRTMANQAGAVLENVRLLEQLRQAADIDQLTGVHNHRYLQERLGQEVARSTRSRSRLSVLMVDLDGFKRINDEHGHGVGDQVLRSVAARLKLAVRETDIVARYGGDEFVVLMPDTSEEQARHVARRLVAGIRGRAFELGEGSSSQLGASVGLAVFPDDGRSPQALLAAADGAMYG